jgi:hypothetical protein
LGGAGRVDYRSGVRIRTLAVPALAAAGWLACAAERPEGTTRRARAPEQSSTATASDAPPEPKQKVSAARATEPRRVYARTRFVWIYPEPNANLEWLGYLSTGGSAPLKSETPRYGPGCSSPFYELEPAGFVCVDDKRATLNAEDPQIALLSAFTPRTDGPWPYRYGESLGLVRYKELPTQEIQERNESDHELQRLNVARARRGEVVKPLAGVDVALPVLGPPPLPIFARSIHEPRSEIRRRSTVAYTSEARHGDRGFLLGADFSWMAKDRVKPYPLDEFHGVTLGTDARLPLAFFRERARPRYQRDAHGVIRETDEFFPRLSHVALTGEVLVEKGVRYLVTWEPGLFVKETDAVVPKPDPSTWSKHAERTVEVSIDGGWLVAFVGRTPVYATLISAGRGGRPVEGKSTLETASTPIGSFTINTKIVTATMEAPNDVVHSDVPWVQNFTGPYALHAAYWHDQWGDPASSGCVNLSPIDARWLFEFSVPKLPAGWHAVRRVAGEASTVVVLHR